MRAKPWAGRLENDIDWQRLNGSHRVLEQYASEGGQCIADMSTPGTARAGPWFAWARPLPQQGFGEGVQAAPRGRVSASVT